MRILPFLPEKRSKLHKEYEHKVTKDIEKAHKMYIRPSILPMKLKTS